MSALPTGFSRFQVRPSEAEELRSTFTFLWETTDLSRTSDVEESVQKFDKVPGIYFWTARVNSDEFKIYVGQTNSLGYRITNYTATFQPHSPNDFKLLVFAAFLAEVAPGATLRLHFREEPLSQLNVEEKKSIDKFKPLLNIRRKPTPESRHQLEIAFSEFYRASFEGLLNDEP